jgi:pyruvate dehydrogenase E2 component (dihydrolipoamide acetyltransferase)
MATLVLPQLGETVTEGTVLRWLKHVGDRVAVDEAVYEVSTDKVDTEVTSPHAGLLTEVLVPAGSTVPVGTPVAVVRPDGAAVAPNPGPVAANPGPVAAGVPSTGGDRSHIRSPLVRRLVDEHHLDLAAIVGTGRGGRVTRDDVLAAAARPGPDGGTPDGERVDFSPIRRRTAEHLRRSWATAAPALLVTEVDFGAVEAARARAGHTALPYVAAAAIDALAAFPRLNATVADDHCVLHRRVRLGIAVDLDREGLVTPTVADADRLRLDALAGELRAVAERARAGRLRADDLVPATFTVTNAGRFGTVASFPILPLGHAAILSVDGVRMAPAARQLPDGQWAVVVRPLGHLSLAFDHRAVDGAEAAAFLAEIRRIVETRDWEAGR